MVTKEDLKYCKICSEEITNNRHFKSKHKLTVAEYYEEYWPKFDLYTQEKIPYTTLNKYFSSDFLNKNNLKKWLKEASEEDSHNYIKRKIEERIVKKNLQYTPSEIELTTSYELPSRIYLDKWVDFDKICQECGLTNRFKSHKEEIKCDVKYQDNEDYWINVDPREQNPLKFKYPKQVKKLDYGDYCLNKPEETGKIYIERKSIMDFAGTMSGGYDRFYNEIIRAKADGAYIIVLVENTIDKVFMLNKLPQMQKTKIKATPDFLLYRMRSLMEEFHNLNFIFCKGRVDAKNVLCKILFSNGICKDIDIQLARQSKLI